MAKKTEQTNQKQRSPFKTVSKNLPFYPDLTNEEQKPFIGCYISELTKLLSFKKIINMSDLEITKERIYDELKDLSKVEIAIIMKSLIEKLVNDGKIKITITIFST